MTDKEVRTREVVRMANNAAVHREGEKAQARYEAKMLAANRKYHREAARIRR